MRFHTALFIYNGNAGHEDIHQKLADTLPIIAKSIKKLTVLQTKTIDEFKENCRSFAGNVDLFIILGGDGTLHACINSIADLEKRPIIAILPGGTCNDFSRMLNIPQNLRGAAAAIDHAQIVDIDVGNAGGTYFLNFWGIGLVSETSLNIVENEKRSLGVLSYFMSTLRTLNQAEQFRYTITGDNQTIEDEAIMILILNGRYIGTRQLPLPSISSTDGKLDVLIVKNSNLVSFREFLSLNSPNKEQEQFTELNHFQAKNINVRTNEEKTIDMDGEIYNKPLFEITLLPKHIQMLKLNAC